MDEKTLLELFGEFEGNYSEELLITIVSRVARIILDPHSDNFHQLIRAHVLYPEGFHVVVKKLNLPQNITGLLELYLAIRKAGVYPREFREILRQTRGEALKTRDWTTLEKYAERQLVQEFSVAKKSRR